MKYICCVEVLMRSISLDEAKIKDLFKRALVEVLQERRELVTDLFEEAFEDAAMVHAIKAGSRSKAVSRSKIFEVLGAGQ
jgi:hypothetical protein